MRATTPELFRALAVVTEGAAPPHQRVAATFGVAAGVAAHTDLFCFQLPPYASIHLGGEGMLGGEAADRVAGFWRALGLVPPPEPDHLAALLGLYAALAEAEASEADAARRLLRAQARSALLWEHLLPWVPGYARAASRVDGGYRPWAETLLSAIEAEATGSRHEGAGAATEASGAGPEPNLPLHLRVAPPPATPEYADGLDGYLAALVAPVRSGMVITRHDLARAAGALGLGLRSGERRYVLSFLVAQDAPAVFGWLAEEATAQARNHDRPAAGAAGSISSFWRERAELCEAGLRRAQRDVAATGAAPVIA